MKCVICKEEVKQPGDAMLSWWSFHPNGYENKGVIMKSGLVHRNWSPCGRQAASRILASGGAILLLDIQGDSVTDAEIDRVTSTYKRWSPEAIADFKACGKWLASENRKAKR